MGLISKEVEIVLGGRNIKWFEDFGYEIPRYKNNKGDLVIKQGTKITVKTENLPKNSSVKVDVQCDGCGEILKDIVWGSYNNYKHDEGKYYCRKCAAKLFASKNQRKSKLQNSKSFEQWCIDNNRQDILNRWDYELNNCKPNEVNCSSSGLRGREGYWFKCPNNHNHTSELKNINSLTQGKQASINCHQCNCIAETHLYLSKYFINQEDTYKYSHGSGRIVPMICPDCGYTRDRKIDDLFLRGFCCPRCSTGYYTEKFLFSVFEQLLNKNFQTQLSRATFKWCKDYRYDFYIEEIEGICECHGNQHYEEINGNWGTLKEIQDNDKVKEQIAKENGIVNYIVLDCRESELEWIKNSIMKSELPKLLNFKEEDIDWLKCHEAGCRKNIVKEVCDLWATLKNVKLIEKELKIERTTVAKYLKQGLELGWCDYDPKEEIKKNNVNTAKRNSKKVVCVTTEEVFNSVKEASKYYGLKSSSGIISCCSDTGRCKTAGKLSDGTKLIWTYYDR